VVEALIAAADDGRWTGIRNACALTLMWRTGARCAETLSINWTDVSVVERRVRIMRPKGVQRGKPPRTLGLDAISVAAIERWRRCCRMQFKIPAAWPLNGPMFCTSNRQAMASCRLRELMPRLTKKIGYPGRVSPHMLRHTFACEVAMEGRPMPWIQSALGHTKMSTTQIYLASLAPVDVLWEMADRE
jgi:site-specific recombinase XerD